MSEAETLAAAPTAESAVVPAETKELADRLAAAEALLKQYGIPAGTPSGEGLGTQADVAAAVAGEAGHPVVDVPLPAADAQGAAVSAPQMAPVVAEPVATAPAAPVALPAAADTPPDVQTLAEETLPAGPAPAVQPAALASEAVVTPPSASADTPAFVEEIKAAREHDEATYLHYVEKAFVPTQGFHMETAKAQLNALSAKHGLDGSLSQITDSGQLVRIRVSFNQDLPLSTVNESMNDLLGGHQGFQSPVPGFKGCYTISSGSLAKPAPMAAPEQTPGFVQKILSSVGIDTGGRGGPG